MFHPIESIFSDEIRVLRLSTILSFCFGIVGVVFAVLSRSRSILFDGLYAFVLSFFTIISARVVRLVKRGDNQEFQFGYGAFEPLVIVVRVLFMFFMYVTLGVDAVKTLAGGGSQVELSLAIIYAAFSAAVSVAFWLALRSSAHRINSPVLIAEAKGWFNDILLYLSVLAAFGIASFLGRTRLAFLVDYADSGITLAIIVCMLPSLVKLFFANIRDLVAAAPSQEIQDELAAIIEGYRAECAFSGFRTYTEKRGRNLYLLVYIVLTREMPVRDLDRLRKRMIHDIRKWWHYSDCDILFTIDPSWIPLTTAAPEAVPAPESAQS
jgi:cation diffusion facilitator family transporter